MGFRNPIRSATDVDTGQPTGPGARLFQDTSGTYPRGVLEFRTGIAGDAPAGAELTSYQTTRGDGTIVSAGSRMRVRGADSNGAVAPWLDLAVQEAAAGGYESVARLKADRLVLDSPSIEYADAGPWTLYTPLWTAGGNPAIVGNGSLIGAWRRLWGRVIELDIVLALGSTSNGGGGQWAFKLPVEAAARETLLQLKTFSGAGTLGGFASTTFGGTQWAVPFSPTTASNGSHQPVRNADNAGTPGTGVPNVPNTYPFVGGHNLVITGRYESKS